MLWYLREVVRPRLGPGSEVLEVGPSRVSVRFLADENALGAARYTAIDTRRLAYHAELASPRRFVPMSVTRMGFADSSFDVILCNHTLPYVEQDRRALAEIRRCLRDDGIAMLDTHLHEGHTRSVAQYRREHPELPDEHFAENGDQWVYGRDFLDRVEDAGLRVRIDRPFERHDAEFTRRNGLKHDQQFIVAFRQRDGEERFAFTAVPPLAHER